MGQVPDDAALAAGAPGGVFCCRCEPHFTLLSANPAFYTLVGYSRTELDNLFGGRYASLIHPEDRGGILDSLAQGGGETVELEYRVFHKDGSVRRMLSQVRPAAAENGERTLYGVLIDITRRKESQEALRLSAERMQVIMDQTNDIIFDWDLINDVIVFSSNWKKRFGYSPIGAEAGPRLSASLNVHPDDRDIYLQLLKRIKAGTPYSEAEYRLLTLSDQYLWHRARATVQYDDEGVPVKAVGVLVDIDAEKHREQKLLEQARRDSLTDLYNKSAAQAQTETLMAQWEPGSVQALMIIDLDDFKRINDQYGHLCGDTVLSSLASCLKALFRASDNIGRIGGDEFLAYLPGLPNREIAMYKAKAVLDALAQIPLREGGATGVSCSIGIAFYPDDGDNFDQLYYAADLALYRAKSQGKSGWAVYDPLACRTPELARLASCAPTEEGEDLDRQLAQFALQLLSCSVSTREAVQQLLELMGRTYDVSRAYVYEFDGLGRCTNTFEWCNAGVEPLIGQMRDLPLCGGGCDYRDNFDASGVYFCRDTAQAEQPMRDYFASMGVRSVLHCAVKDEDTFLGMVGLDACDATRSWTREQVHALSLVSGVLSTFLLKLRLKARVAALERQ